MAAIMEVEPVGTSSTDPSIEHELKDATVSAVTVFNDRAEVTRELGLDDLEEGLQKITLKGLSKRLMNPDSIRVKAFGPCTLLDVLVARITPDVDEDAMKTLNNELQDIQERMRALEDENKLQEAALEALQAYTNYAVQPIGAHSGFEAPKPAEANGIIATFLERSMEAQARQRAINRQLSTEREAQQAVLKKQRELRSQARPRSDLVISLDVAKASSVRLEITYLVAGASWTPAYDLRMNLQDLSMEVCLFQTPPGAPHYKKKGGYGFGFPSFCLLLTLSPLLLPTNVQLRYYGQVQQDTGEDWKDVALTLSTARPAVGGQPPNLNPMLVEFEVARPLRVRKAKMAARSRGAVNSFGGAPSAASMAMPMMAMERAAMHDEMEEDDDADACLEEAPVASASTSSTGLSTNFKIEQPCTVESDNNRHKVTLTILNLGVRTRYLCVPAKSTDVYMQAQVTNTSDTMLLPSSDCNVFCDGSLITTTRLKLVMPGETFTTYLGTDAGIKLDYRPPNESRSQQSSFFQGKTNTAQYVHRCLITNTLGKAATVVVLQALPKPSDSAIRVKVTEPDMAALHGTDKGQVAKRAPADDEFGGGFEDVARGDDVELNSLTNNLIWTRRLEPKAQGEVRLEYAVEYPVDRPIHFREV
ncbi:uncharacterized protein MONBRDRAFT_36474 [Monosiga brevicollis MX1]|uniref:DUF4139 domain-containing protein n=1 Tax=Monosiga brevicollis TaxID=81824 RepID=A9UVF7_MONBE|nr:uncharacterized protein MONBRDRAFT_36474 [Monosiga brevicollis MX1]EDQ90572.1 predicted protein [Monosiga brevicollis MX1]|eukprot:XP_001744623.1 hypothetical protein [Monosiga brevicollis MX1]